jgi:hypothetical protein
MSRLPWIQILNGALIAFVLLAILGWMTVIGWLTMVGQPVS